MPELSRRRDDDYYDADDDFEDFDDDDDFYDDDFTKFYRYRGHDAGEPEEPRHRRGRYVCLHYYSNTVGLTFDDQVLIYPTFYDRNL